MIKMNSFSKSYRAILMILALCATCNAYPMKKNDLALDNLLLGAPYDWQPYLEKYSVKDIITVIKNNENYSTLADYAGDNLMLAFIDFHYEKYKEIKPVYDELFEKKQKYSTLYEDKILPVLNPLKKETLQPFLDLNFDINFQNTKTGDTFLIQLVRKALNNDDYVSLDLFEWLMPTFQTSLNLQNNNGYTALLTSYRNYPIMALLLKYNATRSLPFKNGQGHHHNSNKDIVELETMFGPALTTQGYVYDDEASTLLTHMYTYDSLISKKFCEKDLIKLIDDSKENIAFFNRAAICNDIDVLNYFTKQGKSQILLFKILNHCLTWNRAGATRYALSNLDPNRHMIIEQLLIDNSMISKQLLTDTSKNTTSHSKSRKKLGCTAPFVKIYEYFFSKTSSPNRLSSSNQTIHQPISNAIIETPKIEIAELEKKLIEIYKHAQKDPKTGFKAWLFLEAFDHYLNYGPKKDTTPFIAYKKNYDINFTFN